MPLFRYKAVSGSGEVVEGEMMARTQASVIDHLHDRGFVPIRADEVSASASSDLLRRELFARRGLSRRGVALLTRELATLVHAGLPLDRAFELLIELAENAAAKQLLNRILDALRGGSTFAEALAAQGAVFPSYYVSMVQAGEAGGSLEEVLTRLADFMERAQTLKDKVTSALIYPVIVLLVAGLSVVILLTVVVPEFKPLFADAGQALPLSTQVVVALGDAFQRYWWSGGLVLLALVLLARQQLGNPAIRYRWDGLVLRIPILGDLVTKIEVARFARTVGTLVQNGVALLSALNIAKHTLGNAVLAKSTDGVAESLKQGKGLAEPLMRAALFPPLALHLVRVGEESGKLEEMLIKVADIYDQEVERATQRMLALLVPAVTIFLGLLIAAIIGSVLSALLSVYDLPL